MRGCRVRGGCVASDLRGRPCRSRTRTRTRRPSSPRCAGQSGLSAVLFGVREAGDVHGGGVGGERAAVRPAVRDSCWPTAAVGILHRDYCSCRLTCCTRSGRRPAPRPGSSGPGRTAPTHRPWLTAAVPTESPDCSCRLTLVRAAAQRYTAPRAATVSPHRV